MWFLPPCRALEQGSPLLSRVHIQSLQSSEFVGRLACVRIGSGKCLCFVDRDLPIFVWLSSCPLLGRNVCMRDEVEAWIITNASFLANKVYKIGKEFAVCRMHQLMPTSPAD